MSQWFEASAPARVDLAGGTLDLWPLHVLHPGSVTINLAIDLRARCRVRPGGLGASASRCRTWDTSGSSPSRGSCSPIRGARSRGPLLEGFGIREPRDIELSSDVPFGSGLGGSSALTVAMAAALAASVDRRFEGAGRVEFVRDVETRVLGKPAGTQDYYPPLSGGIHTLEFRPGGVSIRRRDVDPGVWLRHLTLFDTGAAHSSGMNNWEIFRARLEGDHDVAARLEEVARGRPRDGRSGRSDGDFRAMGAASGGSGRRAGDWPRSYRRPGIEPRSRAPQGAGAWGGKGVRRRRRGLRRHSRRRRRRLRRCARRWAG